MSLKTAGKILSSTRGPVKVNEDVITDLRKFPVEPRVERMMYSLFSKLLYRAF